MGVCEYHYSPSPIPMNLKGWVKSSFVDFPGRIAVVVFTAGCNFRCPYCHNSDLVLRPQDIPDIDPDEVLAFLAHRSGLIDGLVITGGEPTLQNDLIEFSRSIAELGIAVKLDTNGSRPGVIERLLAEGLLDYIAMDIKATFARYSLATGVSSDVCKIQESIELIRSSGIDYEFRTTVVPDIILPGDIEIIAQGIAGAKRYVLQQFRQKSTLAPLDGCTPYHEDELLRMAKAAEMWVKSVEVRGG